MNHLLTIDMAMVDWARAQFALTAIYHWLFVPLTLGLAVVMGIMETLYYRTGKPFWIEHSKEKRLSLQAEARQTQRHDNNRKKADCLVCFLFSIIAHYKITLKKGLLHAESVNATRSVGNNST